MGLLFYFGVTGAWALLTTPYLSSVFPLQRSVAHKLRIYGSFTQSSTRKSTRQILEVRLGCSAK